MSFETLEKRELFAANLPAGFTESLVATGLSSPTAMEFAPDGRVFVTEQNGNVRVIKNGALQSSPFVSLPADSTGERGLLGVTVDPNFATNKHLYVYYTTTAGTGESHNRVSRFIATGDTATLASETVLLDLPAVGGGTWHMGGAMKFGTDGKLYVAVGDYQVPANASSLTNPAGKILRLNADGSIPTDNPFYGQTTGMNRAIWALGMRNPFTLAVDPVNGRMYINEVGQSGWEEVNEGAPGAHYGWPGSEGATTLPGYTSPVYQYSHAEGIAIIGGAFYSGVTQTFPAQYAGKYFFGDFGYGWVRTLDPVTKQVATFATGLQFPTGFAAGTDGSLWYLSRGAPSGGLPNTGGVYRIAYDAFQPPAINVEPADKVVSVGDSISFTVEASGSGTLTYQWLRNGSPIGGATGATYSLASTTLADNNAKFSCVVTNAYGSKTTRQATLTVTTNLRPTATILTPVVGSTFAAGTSISFSASANDPETGALPASAFTWQIDYHTGAVTRPFLLPFSGVTGGTFEVPTETPYTEANVFFRVILTVTDPAGLTHTVTRDVAPRTASITLATNIPGAKVEIDGQPKSGPYTTVGVEGIRRSIGVPLVQTVNGITYQFDGWSDGGAATHSIFTPGAATTYTAIYKPRQAVYVSDLPFNGTPLNTWGPVERDRSNGEAAAGDGRIITLNGVTYAKGLGVHANSEVSFKLDGQYERFIADVGVDDEVDNAGSVIFQVWADGVKLFDSGLMAGPSATQRVDVDVTNKLRLKLVVLNGGDDATLDHASWADARLLLPLTTPPAPPSTVYASDLPFVGTPSNGWGPVERDRSNNGNAAGDGRVLTLNGTTYAKGFGVHAPSEITIDLGGRYALFESDIGIDDEEGNNGSVIFQVWADGVKLYDSGVMWGSTPTKNVELFVAGKQQLKLIVTDAGINNNYNDHADWANARLTLDPGAAPPSSGSVISVEEPGGSFEGGGDMPAGTIVFVVSRDNADAAASVNYTTVHGTTNASDFTPVSGTLNFAAGELTKTVTVFLTGDLTVEPDETFLLRLSNAAGATIGVAEATAFIVNDDLAEISVANASVAEGASGTKNLVFTLTRTDATLASSVTFSTADITATAADNDYVPLTGVAEFAPGALTTTVAVQIRGDTKVELDETFALTLLDATNAFIGDAGAAIGTIINDDLPTLAISDASVTEGNSGTADLVFTVTRSDGTLASSVNWATAGGTATSGVDFTSSSGTLAFAPGELTKTITIKVIGDGDIEPNETLTVNLSSPTNATIADGQGLGTIVNDDATTGFTIADVTQNEGRSNDTTFTFTVTRPSGVGTASVRWATANGTAAAGSDYTAGSGTLSFAAGQLSRTFTVTVKGDVTVESDETFLVNLNTPVGATIARGQAVATIRNDDIAPQVLEAETAVLTNTTITKQYNGYTGTAYVRFAEAAAAGDKITWSTSLTIGGSRQLQIRYANGGTAARNLQLVVNGVVVRPALAFAATGGWTKWNLVTLLVDLPAGANTISLVSPGGPGPTIDSLTVS